MLRAFQLGLSMDQLDEFTEGDIINLLIEQSNDYAHYDYVATQEDMDRFAAM